MSSVSGSAGPRQNSSAQASPKNDNGEEGHHEKFWALALGATGVVFGDIGTSPLYAFREAALRATGEGVHTVTPDIVLGLLSLMIWALMIVVTIKYVLFLLRADNNGEGGILSLMALARENAGKLGGVALVLGIAGAALFYGDAAITPAISVMAAVEGLRLVTPVFHHFVLPLSILILVVLFSTQKYGTAWISVFFGPVTAFWFLLLGATGLAHIVQDPEVLLALSPTYASAFLINHSGITMAVLGSVFLTVTGAEALYADLGHFGRKPIQVIWLTLVLPCLILNYMGQGALVLHNPKTITDPFFHLVPPWALVPLVAMATVATIIASQAVITGAYSLTRQAIQLGLLPRMNIRHTSHDQEGQIYMPKVNRLLLVAVILLCLIFGSSGALASAYGIAVSGTLIATSILAFILVWKNWKKNPLLALLMIAPLLAVEVVFFCANSLKVFDGGFVPLFIAGTLGLLMAIWVRGSRYLYGYFHAHAVNIGDFIKGLEKEPPVWVGGTAIFLTTDQDIVPMALLQNLRHNKVMHKNNILVKVIIAPVPRVPAKQRAVIKNLSPNLVRVDLTYGYMQTPDVPRGLVIASRKDDDHALDIADATYFIGRRTLVADANIGLPLWQARFYVAMNRAAESATNFFCIPPARVLELGKQIEV